MDFRTELFFQLRGMGERPVLREGTVATSARELMAIAGGARAFLGNAGIGAGDRVVLIGENSVRWVALDLALAFEGVVCVPLYARQAPGELAAMIRDADARFVLCADGDILTAVERALGANPPRTGLFEEAVGEAECGEPVPRAAGDAIRIIYTSGTSGPAKGVVYSIANIDFMLPHTVGRIDRVMRGAREAERTFHYLPCCFAGSWILLQSALRRGAELTFCTDLKQLGEQMRAANPHYVLNVPLLLERVRDGIETVIRERGGVGAWIWSKPWLARFLLAPFVRRQIAPALRCLICGSAPLAEETQRFFGRIALPVLQVYGLTETTAICTMDEPGAVVPGRVGRAIDGCAMRTDEHGEILVRGPNVFGGYWGKPPREGEWYATGDLGEVDAHGYWRIVGRRKHLIVLAGGHNVPPEELEDALRLDVAGASHAMLVGHGRKSLVAILAGAGLDAAAAEAARERLNETLPHYKRIRALHLHMEPFTPDSGLLTANGKLKRAVIEKRFAAEIDRMYS